jgi:predicted dehydrogenase
MGVMRTRDVSFVFDLQPGGQTMSNALAAASNASPITTALIGLGRAGWNIHVQGIRNRADYKIIAAADALPERRDQARNELGCAVYADFKTLLRQCAPKPELVIIANQTRDHCPDALKSLNAGCHALVEKPCGVNAAEVKRMIAVAQKSGKRLFMHHNYRFKKEAQYLFARMKDAPIGPVFEIRLNVLGYARRGDWQTLKKNGGGLLRNHGTHYLDIILQMLNAPVADIFCDLKHIADAGDGEDHCKVILRTADGVLADCTLSTKTQATLPRWMLCGRYGTLTFDGHKAKLKFYDPQKVPELTPDETAPKERQYGTGEFLPWEEKEESAAGFERGDIYDDIVKVLRHGGTPYVAMESVLETVRLLDRCLKQNPQFK